MISVWLAIICLAVVLCALGFGLCGAAANGDEQLSERDRERFSAAAERRAAAAVRPSGSVTALGARRPPEAR